MNKNKIIIKVLFWLTVIFFMTIFASLFIELGSIFEIIGFFSFNILLLLAIVYFKFIKKDKIKNMGLFKKKTLLRHMILKQGNLTKLHLT